MARTQVRLGLVIEGGVSLAVWMSGVAHEIDLLRRAGSPGREPLANDGEAEALRRWRALCDELDVDVIVDVVSGTSAGGLNGAWLACAVAAGRPLPPLKKLWVETAQLERGALLRPNDLTPLPSLLNGDFFGGQLSSVFRQALGEGDGTSALHPVTLLTTATALGHEMAVWEDSSEQQFEVADHRRVYRFRNDPSLVQFSPPGPEIPADPFELFTAHDPRELQPDSVAAIARAARATAGFPAAFDPVDEHDDTADLRPYRVSRRWNSAVLIDGGVLDNTPFEPLLEEIARRPVDGDWRRVIGYVVANDGLAESTVPMQPDQGPRQIAREWFPVLTSALRMSSETSFRHGVEALAQRRLEAERLVSGPENLFTQILKGEGPDVAAIEPLYGLYRQNRVESGLLDAYLLRAEQLAARPLQIPKLPDDTDPDDAPLWVPPKNLPEALGATEWLWGTAVADRTVRLFLRHLQRWGRSQTTAVDVGPALGELSRVLSAIAAVRDFVASQILTAPNSDPNELLNAINAATQASSGPLVVKALMSHAVEAYTGARTDLAVGHDDVLRAGLTVEIVLQAVSGRLPFSRPARFDTIRMGPDVECPVIEAPPLPGKLQPRPMGAWKLYGTQLGHFGSFGRPRWREHDFVWGRLDGAAHLVRVLSRCSGSPLRDHEAALTKIAAAQDAVLNEEGADRTRMEQELGELTRLNTQVTLDKIRSTPDGRQTAVDTVTDIFRMLSLRGKGTPEVVPEAGEWLSAALALQLPKSHARFLQRIVRVISRVWPRPPFWAWIGNPKKTYD